jgi:hypothetical protein
MCEWHGGLAIAAIANLSTFLATNDLDSDDACQHFAKSTLKEYKFLYAEIRERKGEVGFEPT